jgi:hypothetical protein
MRRRKMHSSAGVSRRDAGLRVGNCYDVMPATSVTGEHIDPSILVGRRVAFSPDVKSTVSRKDELWTEKAIRTSSPD